MRSVTVRVPAAEFSARIIEIVGWLDANRYEPARYTYDHNEDAVLVTIDFAAEMAAEAFSNRFDGVFHSPPQPGSPGTAPVCG